MPVCLDSPGEPAYDNVDEGAYKRKRSAKKCGILIPIQEPVDRLTGALLRPVVVHCIEQGKRKEHQSVGCFESDICDHEGANVGDEGYRVHSACVHDTERIVCSPESLKALRVEERPVGAHHEEVHGRDNLKQDVVDQKQAAFLANLHVVRAVERDEHQYSRKESGPERQLLGQEKHWIYVEGVSIQP